MDNSHKFHVYLSGKYVNTGSSTMGQLTAAPPSRSVIMATSLNEIVHIQKCYYDPIPLQGISSVAMA